MERGLWIKHGVTAKGHPCYCPAIMCEGAIGDIYVCEVNDGALEYNEKVNKKGLGKYAASEARWGNNTALRDFYKQRMERKKGSGSLKKADKSTNERSAALAKKQDSYL